MARSTTPPAAEPAWPLAVAGVLAALVSQLHMGTSWRVGVDPGERTELVTTGGIRGGPQPDLHRDDRHQPGYHPDGAERGVAAFCNG